MSRTIKSLILILMLLSVIAYLYFLHEEKTAAVIEEQLVVDLNSCSMFLLRDGNVYKKYTVAIGSGQTPSPVGEWRITHKGGNWGGGFGTRWLGLNVPWGIYGIHGTDNPNSIGYRASHGCIRMHNKQVEELYSLIKVGTPVIIRGKLPSVNWGNVYCRGASGAAVLHLQFALREKGFDQGAADARFGERMESMVQKFQAFWGLEVNGKIGLDEQYLLGVRQ